MILPNNDFLNDQDDDLRSPTDAENPGNGNGNSDNSRIEPEEGARPGEEEYMEDGDYPATEEDLDETGIVSPDEDPDITADDDEIDLSEEDEVDFEADDDEVLLPDEDDDEIVNPDEEERPASGINVNPDFVNRPQGRTTGRMIDHEPGTPGI